MLMIVAVPESNNVIVTPDRIECNPISSFVNPNISYLIILTIALSRGSACAKFIHVILPSEERKEHIFESSMALGISNTRFTDMTEATTGHNKLSSVRNICTEWLIQSLF